MSELHSNIPASILTRCDHIVPAIYEWMLANDGVPHVVVNANMEGVVAPPNLVSEQGHIVYNLNPTAIRNLSFDDGWVMFNARINGQEMQISFPAISVLQMFDRESGVAEHINTPELQALYVEMNGGDEPVPETEKPKTKSFLKVVK